MVFESPSSSRSIDALAIEAALRRLARRGEAPWLHNEVARRMTERLALIRLKPDLLIEWWPGLGGGSEELLKAYPKARRLWVAPTADWLAVDRRSGHAPWWSAARWRGSVPEVSLESKELRSAVGEGAQLIWANMMLHAVVNPPALMEHWQQLLAVDGFVMFSCLGPGSLSELRALYRKLGWPSPAADFVDMHDLGDMLLQAGFADPVMDQEVITLTWASPDALMAELRQLGSNASPSRWPGLRTPRWAAQLRQALAALAGADGRLRLTFEIAYGHAFKAAPKNRGKPETAVSLDEMRSLLRASREQG